MRIIVGSKNEVKVGAVRELVPEYPFMASAEISGFDAKSGVADQPKTLEETVTGAMNRARGAWESGACDAALGIESGLMVVPFTKTGHMDVCACAIYDGAEFHLGLSSAWEVPADAAKLMLEQGLDMNDAFNQAGYTDNPKIGSAEGAIGLLTKGRVDRKAYTKEAVRMALIHLERAHDLKRGA